MNSNKKGIIAPIVVTILMILYCIVYFGAIVATVQGLLKYVFGIIPIIFIGIMIGVLKERIKEIKEGEDDDISEY
jgi:hypothetical protein